MYFYCYVYVFVLLRLCILIVMYVLCTLFHCVVLCTVCVQMCAVLLPPGVNPIAVNKIYIISTQILNIRHIWKIVKSDH